SELERAIINLSAVMEQIGNETSDTVTSLQEDVSQIAKIATQNRMALDMLLASQGGVCT
ncbi:ERVV1 protein, partial [Chordeiles acutipennis]|nr:ERVV1 protein [Chordeiles acutipennis]